MIRIWLYFLVVIIYTGLGIMSGVYWATGKKGLAVLAFVSALATFYFYLIKRWRQIRLLVSKSRPVVRVWTHDDETVVTSEEVYRLSLGLRDQLLVAYPWIRHTLRVRPLICSVQSNKRCGDLITHEQLKAIKDSCSVCNTEMQIPGEDMVSFEQMWWLLHGSDAKPPELPEPTN